MIPRWFSLIFLCFSLFGIGIWGCQEHSLKEEASNPPSFRNLTDSAHYVGITTCKGCHQDKFATFLHTGMGRSFRRANRSNSDAHFDHIVLYDSVLKLFYYPFLRADSIFIMEYRLYKGETIHKRIEPVSYIIGSGHHTNSHLLERNGYFYQAPITFYTQRRKWDFAPGYEGGNNIRFSRSIGWECMTCHNGMPVVDTFAFHRYYHVVEGIDCERCHGPGSLHVEEKRRGIIVDTSKNADLSIVNPKRLSREKQMSLCSRCHLQGIAVLNPGKTFLDFKPGMSLSTVMQVFVPEYQSEGTFWMASHVKRLKESQCYQKSTTLTCLTCHNPHISVKETPTEKLNQPCQSCHQSGCKLPEKERGEQPNHCVYCHMPQSPSIDIPHVAITDHRIGIYRSRRYQRGFLSMTEAQKQFLRLRLMSEDREATPLEKARAYLRYYEGFHPNPRFLDSVAFYLQEVDPNQVQREWTHYHYLKGAWDQLITRKVSQPTDPWEWYWIGEAHFQLGNFHQAIPYFEECVKLKPHHPPFLNKLASAYYLVGNFKRARALLEQIIQLDSTFSQAWANLGQIDFVQKRYRAAKHHFEKAIHLDPNYRFAYQGYIRSLLALQDWNQAEKQIEIYKFFLGNDKEIQQLEKQYKSLKSLLKRKKGS